MRDFVLLFKVLYKNQRTHIGISGSKRRFSQKTAMLIASALTALLMCAIVGFIAAVIPNRETLSLVANVVVSAVQLFVLFTGLFNAINVLFSSSDVPFLNTLPLRPTAVFFAKFAIVYVNSLKFMAGMLIPTLLTMSIVYAALGGTMFYGFFPLVILITLVAPILPLFVITVFSMPISYIGTYFKGKSVLKTILTLVFFMGVMCGYFLLIFFMNRSDAGEVDGEAAMASMLGGLSIFSKVMYPNKVLIDFCLGIDAGKNFGIWVAVTVGIIALMMLLAVFFYRRINQKQLENRAETSHKAVSYKQNNMIAALMKKDFLSLIRNSYMAMTCLANTLLCPIITVIMYFSNGGIREGEVSALFSDMLNLSYVVLYTTIFLAGVNVTAMISYTREGKAFTLAKTLPIRAKDSIYAKLFISLIVPAIVLAVQAIVALALYKINAINVLLCVICAALAIVGAACLHIYSDMRFGNVNWSTRQDLKQVSNRNIGSLLVALTTVAIGIIAMILGIVLSIFESVFASESAVYAVYWAVVFALSATLATVGICVLHFKAERYYGQIGERQFTPKVKAGRGQKGGFGGGRLMR